MQRLGLLYETTVVMRRTLSSSGEGAKGVLTKQNSMLTEAKTNVLRLEALNKFIVAKEKHTGGGRSKSRRCATGSDSKRASKA